MDEPKRPATVLLVGDLRANRDLLRAALQQDGYGVSTVETGEGALEAVPMLDPDVILLGVVPPGIDELEVCRRLKQAPATRLIPVVLASGRGRAAKLEAMRAGADDVLSEPLDIDELRARVKSLVRFKRYTNELDAAMAVILDLALNVEARLPDTKGHCQRLARYATSLGRRIGLKEWQLAALHRGAFLHDIGNISIPEAILLKPDALTADEYAIIKRHPLIGDTLCGTMHALQAVRPIIRHHHERLDGTGYPDGLRGDTIPLMAQIITVADVYDALTNDRLFRYALSTEEACEELQEGVRRGWYQRDLVSEFIAVNTAA